jgi:glucosamine-6-phosphate deaminase
MEIIIRKDENAAARLVAQLIAKAMKAKPNLVLGLATGRTMEAVYQHLARMHREDELDFSLCRTFNLDEYVGLSGKDPHSYRFYMNRHLFQHVNIDLRNTFLPDGLAADLDRECARYEETIEACGGIDLQLLGIGRDGHIGFNEPLSALRSRTRVKALAPMTLEQNGPLFGDIHKVPRRAITMGVGTILDAGRCLVLVIGAEKAGILAKAMEGPITAMVSASALQLHPRCTVITDEAAAGKLQETDYYRWIFDHEPEWQEFQKT